MTKQVLVLSLERKVQDPFQEEFNGAAIYIPKSEGVDVENL